MKIFKNLEKENFLIIQLLFLTSLFPITYLLGNSIINLFLFLISITYLIFIFKKKIFFDFKDLSFLSLILLWLTYLINLLFSQDPSLSINRVLKFFFIIFFISAIKYIIRYKNYLFEKFIFKTWSIIFIIVFFDLIFEYFFGHNLTGNSSYMPGRLTSFIGDELVIGYFYLGFALFAFIYFHKEFKNNKYNYLLLILLVGVSFLIGERSNFIKTFFIIILFSLFVYDIKFKFKIFSIILTICLAILFLNFNENYKGRYFKQVSSIFAKDGISKYLDNSIYGAHYSVATEIFKDNPVFGVGIKNFRVESFKKKYDNIDHKQNHLRGNTHPHQIHYEFLSETGLFGYFSFLIFILFSLYYSIKNYINTKNMFQLSGILFVISSLIPLIPSGSFFSTYPSSIFWINYALMMSYINFKK